MSTTQVVPILSVETVSDTVFLLKVPFESKPLPGQFVMIRPEEKRTDPFLPRPISVCDWRDGVLSLLIAVVGRGTALLSDMRAGNMVRVTGYLGNAFPDDTETVWFVGGGIGAAPLIYAFRESRASDKKIMFGFRNKSNVLDSSSFFGVTAEVATDDASAGFAGSVVSLCEQRLQEASVLPKMMCTCGPEVMMKALQVVARRYSVPLFHSLESVMGCGIGACLGCRRELPGRSVLVCKDGPVFSGDDIYPEVIS